VSIPSIVTELVLGVGRSLLKVIKKRRVKTARVDVTPITVDDLKADARLHDKQEKKP